MKKVLITGAAGFIGFHLARFLHARGDVVVGLDNFNGYYDPQLKRARVAELQGVEMIEADICDSVRLEEIVAAGKFTHIVHLAAQAGVRYSVENPRAYLDANLAGFLNILEICRRHPAIKLVYASSSSVYGLNSKVPFSETDPTDAQASFYGVTKKSNELMAQSYHHLYGISATGLRYFTVYGPWGRPDMAYYSFARAIMRGEPIKVYNEGHLMRDFTYIDDIVQGTAAAVDRGAPCALYNLGNHKPVRLLDFIALLEDALSKKAIKEMVPMQPGDVLQTYADIEKARTDLGFEPKTSLEFGLTAFVRWFLNHPRS